MSSYADIFNLNLSGLWKQGGFDRLTYAEVSQLANIDSETISNAQWAYLANQDQALSTTDIVAFGGITDSSASDSRLLATNGVNRYVSTNLNSWITSANALLSVDADGNGGVSLTVNNDSIDHGSLSGLGDDDHTQYYNSTRLDTWWGLKTTADLPEGTNLYWTTGRVLGTTNQITATPSGNNIVLSTPQDLDTGANFQVGTIGIGTPASTDFSQLINGTAVAYQPICVTTADLTTNNAFIHSFQSDQATAGSGSRAFIEVRRMTTDNIPVGLRIANTTYGEGLDIYMPSGSDDLVFDRIGGPANVIRISGGDVGIGAAPLARTYFKTGTHRLSVYDTANSVSSIVVDSTDQRLTLASYWESGVGQYSYIQSTNNAETSYVALLLNPAGGDVGIGGPLQTIYMYRGHLDIPFLKSVIVLFGRIYTLAQH